MDLSSMLNDGPPPDKTAPQKSPEVQRSGYPPAYTPGAPNGPPATPGGYALPTHQQTPLYATPTQDRHSQDRSMVSQSRGLTPLRTPSAAQHQPLAYPQQSPIAPPGGHQYRPSYESYSAQTPGGILPGGGHQGSPGGVYQSNGGPQALQRQPTSSHSSTPQSHHSQVPHSLRQSPVTGLSQGTNQHPSYQQPHQSTPSTPLGPPPLHYQRTSHHSQADAHSPHLQRNFSGASNGVVAGSPAQHHPSIGNLLDSPSTYQRPSPQHIRRTSDYLSQVDRERSVSVSPKTKVPPRPPSLGSRHSSQEMYSARNSMQPGGVSATTTLPHNPAVASQPPHANMASEVAQPPALSAQTSMASTVAGKAEGAESGAPLSQASSLSPTLKQHQPQRMGMNQLLASTNGSGNQAVNMNNNMPSQGVKTNQGPRPSPGPKKEAVAAPPPMDTKPVNEIHGEGVYHDTMSNGTTYHVQQDTKPSLKRLAETTPAAEPPTKRSKRKYQERPIWARYSAKNPRANGGAVPNGAVPLHQQPPSQKNKQPPAPPQTHPQPPTNGVADAENPWLENPPLDHDLMNARSLLGQWEKTFEWTEPASSMSKYVQQWLYQTLAKYENIGHDPRQGTLEIEAKIGTLFSKASDQRVNLPVTTATVINPDLNHHYYFESEMGPAEHQHMNQYLNATTQKSNTRGRVPISYKHTYETDTFSPLSQAGLNALPPAIKNHTTQQNRELRLRTTTNTKTQAVTARIIKLKLADLHIYNPADSYDCRVSINLESNMDVPELDPELITMPPSATHPPQPERRKDRLSYKHLAYQVDLTKVDVAGMPGSKYELEVEVDAKVLREQLQLAVEGKGNAYREVVEGFLNDVTFLMRQRGAGVGV